MARRWDFKIKQGATFRRRFTWKSRTTGLPVDLTGCTARMQIRTGFAATTVLVDLTTENGGITLGGAAGTIAILITADQTAAIEVAGSEGVPPIRPAVHDAFLTWPDGSVDPLWQGSAAIERRATQ